jgi:hypothetical protein
MSGVVSHLGKKETIQSKDKTKTYDKQWFCVNNGQEYKNTLAIEAFGKSVDFVNGINVGDTVQVEFEVSSSEFKDRWFTKADLSSVKVTARGNVAPSPADAFGDFQVQEDDFPF